VILLTNHFICKPGLVLSAILALSAAGAVKADIDLPFEAVYEVYIDGKPRMETTISLSKQGDYWLMNNSGKGTRGLPRMLKLRNSESSKLKFSNQEFQVIEHSHQTKVAGKDDSWNARFDRENNQIVTTHEHGESTLEPASGVLDPLTLTLAIRDGLSRGTTSLEFNIVDETEIDQHLYLAGEAIDLETNLGCYKVIPAVRSRENSSRYSTGWYAKELAFLPLKLIHGKKGGKEFEMRITSLVLDGQEVLAPRACPS
jgi:hypothetical protein